MSKRTAHILDKPRELRKHLRALALLVLIAIFLGTCFAWLQSRSFFRRAWSNKHSWTILTSADSARLFPQNDVSFDAFDTNNWQTTILIDVLSPRPEHHWYLPGEGIEVRSAIPKQPLTPQQRELAIRLMREHFAGLPLDRRLAASTAGRVVVMWGALGDTLRAGAFHAAFIAPLLALVLAARRWLRALRCKPHECQRCRYDLRGLAPGAHICPECSAPITRRGSPQVVSGSPAPSSPPSPESPAR